MDHNNESQSQLNDSGAKTLPSVCTCNREHVDKHMKETMQVNKQITRRSRFQLFFNSSQPHEIHKLRDRAVSRIPAMQLK